MDQAMCSIEGCHRVAKARGWCGTHWKRWRTHGDPLVTAYNQPKPRCSIDGCRNEAYGKGWCSMHWQRWRRNGDPLLTVRRPPVTRGDECAVAGCGKPVKALGWCAMHYARWQKTGSLGEAGLIRHPLGICTIAGCDEPVECKDLCNRHYLRFRKYGDALVSLVSAITVTCSNQDASAGRPRRECAGRIPHLHQRVHGGTGRPMRYLQSS